MAHNGAGHGSMKTLGFLRKITCETTGSLWTSSRNGKCGTIELVLYRTVCMEISISTALIVYVN